MRMYVYNYIVYTLYKYAYYYYDIGQGFISEDPVFIL